MKPPTPSNFCKKRGLRAAKRLEVQGVPFDETRAAAPHSSKPPAGGCPPQEAARPT